ncbi:hypothetical protein A9Q89_13120 [Gammaproteobacteria bacterium 53_120_T64]|nr:hypothetical protein A9Q89_13120 [Gammaproteobacteria bacterium 53_120_T64]
MLLLVGILSIEACQQTVPIATERGAQILNADAPSKVERVPIAIKTAVEEGAVLAVRQAVAALKMDEKRFIIPVARSGDFAPAQLDDYVLSIIEQSRQWDSVAELQVHGHTDSEGSALSNMLLSLRRANLVAERFEELGVEAGLLLVEAHGESQAIADNTTLDGRIANRRIEVVLKGHPGVAVGLGVGDGVLLSQGEGP